MRSVLCPPVSALWLGCACGRASQRWGLETLDSSSRETRRSRSHARACSAPLTSHVSLQTP
eukprot:6364413-Prymnesium_polylepis.2